MTHAYARILVVACLAMACSGGDRGQSGPIEKTALPPVQIRADDPALVQYTLRFPERRAHYVEVEGVFPATADALELSMAVWTPGSYLVREYSRHVDSVTAATPEGERLEIDKVKKNRWRVVTGGARRVVVRYRVYSSVVSVRTNYVCDDMAVLNGAATFMTIADETTRPFDIAFEMPEGWQHSVTALDPHPSGVPHRYVAPDFDTLVDSPFVIGNPSLHTFEVEGVPHVLANAGGSDVWDGPRSAKDLQTLVEAHVAFWKTIPYRRYVFLNVLLARSGSQGGLEHKGSTLMTAHPFASRVRDQYHDWLGLASHEFFHTWNIKRMRPSELGPFDYENENYTESLWIAEGITSYYDDLMLRRAGLIDDEQYVSRLGKQIETLQTMPGRQVQSLAESSFDAWIKYYRQDENAKNTQISYYTKGAVVGFLLDAEIRRATQGQRSLDDVMRLAYQRHSAERGYTPEEFRAIVAEVVGRSLDDFLARLVESTQELDFAPALAHLGLRFAAPKPGEPGDEPPGYLGAAVDAAGVVDIVLHGSPAFDAGVNPGDEILSIDEYRVTGKNLDERLKSYRPGAEIRLQVARHGKLRMLAVKLGEKPRDAWKLELDPRVSTLVKARRDRWLTGR